MKSCTSQALPGPAVFRRYTDIALPIGAYPPRRSFRPGRRRRLLDRGVKAERQAAFLQGGPEFFLRTGRRRRMRRRPANGFTSTCRGIAPSEKTRKIAAPATSRSCYFSSGEFPVYSLAKGWFFICDGLRLKNRSGGTATAGPRRARVLRRALSAIPRLSRPPRTAEKILLAGLLSSQPLFKFLNS